MEKNIRDRQGKTKKQEGIFLKSFFKGKTLLVISPHADDETAGCGGTLSRAKQEGAQTYCLVLSVGDLAHYARDLQVTEGTRRKEELWKALAILKVDDWEVVFEESEKYMKLDLLPRQELMHRIEQKARLSINKLKPDLVFIPHPSSHQDHEAVYQACFSALRPHHPAYHHLPDLVLVYEAPQVSWSSQLFSPNFYVDISAHLVRKKEAFLAHQSQQTEHPHPFCWENIERLSRLRGAEAGMDAAEAFCALRVRV